MRRRGLRTASQTKARPSCDRRILVATVLLVAAARRATDIATQSCLRGSALRSSSTATACAWQLNNQLEYSFSVCVYMWHWLYRRSACMYESRPASSELSIATGTLSNAKRGALMRQYTSSVSFGQTCISAPTNSNLFFRYFGQFRVRVCSRATTKRPFPTDQKRQKCPRNKFRI